MFLIKFFSGTVLDDSSEVDCSTVAMAEAWARTYAKPWQTWTVEPVSLAKWLYESTINQVGLTDSESAILCDCCKRRWERVMSDVAEQNWYPADSDLKCDECGAV